MDIRAVFLFDGPNFYKNLKRSGLQRGHFDFMKLAKNLASGRKVKDVVLYTSPTDQEKDRENYIKQQRFFAAIKESGVTLKLGKLVDRSYTCQDCGVTTSFKTEKSVDVQFAIDLVLGAAQDEWDVAYIATCDSDFVPAIKFVRSLGKKVFLILPEKASCYSVGNECDCSIRLTQEILDNSQADFPLKKR